MPSEDFSDRRHPFDNTPDLRFFYVNAAIEAVRDNLLSDVLARKGLRLLVGESGLGKTTLLLDLKNKLEETGCLVVLTRGTETAFDELLDACWDRLGRAGTTNNRMERIRALAELLVQRTAAGATTALLIDDAEVLTDDALEDLSWLTDLEKDGQKLVQIVLAGQPDLVPRLCGSRLLFVQDSAIDYCGLKPLTPREVGQYIQYRLKAAGFHEARLFSTEAIERIAEYTEGGPRQINQLCTTSLQIAEPASGGVVSADTVGTAARRLMSSPRPDGLADNSDGSQFVVESLESHLATPKAAAAESGGHPAEPATCDDPEAGPDAPLEIPAQPVSDEGRADTSGAPRDGAVGNGQAFPDRPPIYGDLWGGPTLAPFPSNLTIPAADIRPARRRGGMARIAALFLVGLALGGTGMFFFQDRVRLPSETPGTPFSVSGVGSAQPTASGADVAQRTARTREAGPLDAAATIRQAPPKPPAVSAPTLTVARAKGREDQAIPLDIRAAAAVAATLTVAVSDLPEGARLSSGHDSGDGIWSLSRQDLPGLALRLAPDFSGPLRLTVDASARWPDGRSASASEVLTVEVAGAADPPVLDVAEAKGRENTAIPLDIYAALADTDGSESLSVTVSDLPEGARLSTGQDDGTGRWRLTPAELSDLTLTPPDRFAGRFELTVAATSREADGDSATRTALLKVDVAPAPLAYAKAKGDFVLQLAALRSAGDAEREVARLRGRFQQLLESVPLKIYEAEVNGIPYYRVRTDPVPDKAEVFRMCEELKRNQQDCMVLQQIAEARPTVARTSPQTAGPAPVSLLPGDAPLALAETPGPKLATKAQDLGLAVRDLVIARDVVDREPAELTTTFTPQDGRAFAHAKFYNPGPPTEVSFVWLYDDALYATVDMKVGTSVRWRTWSSAEVWLGKWRVQIVSADGEVLAENAFTVH